MLGIKSMSEEDMVFNFTKELNPYHRGELMKAKTPNLATAMSFVDSLMNLNFSGTGKYLRNDKPLRPKRRSRSLQKGGQERQRHIERVYEEMKSKSTSLNASFFICEVPHRVKECPKRERLECS